MKIINKKLLTTKTLELGRENSDGKQKSRKFGIFDLFFSVNKLEQWLKYGIILLIPFIILTPGLRITSPAIRVDEIILLFGLLVYCLLVIKRKKIKISVLDYIFGALFVSTAASILFSYLFIGYDFYFNDLFEFAKIIKYYLIYRIIYDLEWSRDDASDLLKAFLLSAIVAITIGVMQYFNSFGINSIMEAYTRPIHIRAIKVAGRIIGTFGNANSWALFLGLPLFFIFGTLIRRLEQQVSKKSYFILILLFFVLVSMIVTLGRTSIVANFAGLLAISGGLLFFPYKSRQRVVKEIFIVFLLFITFSGLAFYTIELIPNAKGKLNVAQRMGAGLQEMGLVSEGTIEGDFKSWGSRTKKWKNSLYLVSKNPVFGYGPSKSVEAKENVPYATDNEYVLYLYRYGLVGLVSYLSLFGFFFISALANLRKSTKKHSPVFTLNIIALGISVSYPLYNILAGSFYDFQLFPLFMIFGSLNYYFLKKHEKQ
ncbi:MAG: O-antigen ligase family protein [Patescibacteria group bacterium]|nr:O-antigen ligase family protein [Patescibacteria group bacterium]